MSGLWGLAMSASAVATLMLDGWQDGLHIRAIAILFGLSAVVAYPTATMIAEFLTRRGRFETRLAAQLFALASVTLGVTSLAYAFYYRSYFAMWHDTTLSITWTYQLVFTVLGALYQFAVFGMRLYLPVGIPALFLFALWQSSKPR